jgi:hypothetical protein
MAHQRSSELARLLPVPHSSPASLGYGRLVCLLACLLGRWQRAVFSHCDSQIFQQWRLGGRDTQFVRLVLTHYPVIIPFTQEEGG